MSNVSGISKRRKAHSEPLSDDAWTQTWRVHNPESSTAEEKARVYSLLFASIVEILYPPTYLPAEADWEIGEYCSATDRLEAC